MEERANVIFNGLGKCLAEASWLAAGKQPKLKVICPKTIKYLHLPKPLINGRRQTSSFAFLPLTAPGCEVREGPIRHWSFEQKVQRSAKHPSVAAYSRI